MKMIICLKTAGARTCLTNTKQIKKTRTKYSRL